MGAERVLVKDIDRDFLAYCGTRKWCRKLVLLAKLLYSNDDAHGFGHILRVTLLSFMLARRSHADVDVVVAASLLHDVGRIGEHTGLHHAQASAIIAEPLLRGIGFPEEKIGLAIRAIIAHSFSLGAEKRSIEECIVSDADKIDALGAIGVYRMIYYSGERKRGIRDTLSHYNSKIRRLVNELCLEESKRLGEKISLITSNYFTALEKEFSIYEELEENIGRLASLPQ